MAFYDIFEQLCREKGITPTQAGRENGIKQGTVSMWKKRGTFPNAPTLIQLADYFDTTPAYLMGNDMAKEPASPRVEEPLIYKTPLDNEIISLEIKKRQGTATDDELESLPQLEAKRNKILDEYEARPEVQEFLKIMDTLSPEDLKRAVAVLNVMFQKYKGEFADPE